MNDVKSIKKIDIHAHATPFRQYAPLRDPDNPNSKHLSPEMLIEEYDKLGIEKGILLTGLPPECLFPSVPSENCKYMVDQHPDRLDWFCNVDPRTEPKNGKSLYETFVRLLMHYKSLGAKGVGEITAHIDADDPRLDTLFAACEACDMPVTIHIAPVRGGTYGIYDELGLPRIEKILQKHPNLKLLGHSQPFWAEISGDLTEEIRFDYPTGPVAEGGKIVELFRKYPNLYGDLSAGSASNALMRDPEFTAKFVEEFADRLMYGCDICAPSPVFPYKFRDFLEQMVESGKISLENYRKIVRENAIRILKLED